MLIDVLVFSCIVLVQFIHVDVSMLHAYLSAGRQLQFHDLRRVYMDVVPRKEGLSRHPAEVFSSL
jgi:hypothetical protein